MSVLTKIFVVSLVVLSLLLSAAAITFVNAVDDYKSSLEAANNAVQQANAKASEAAANATSEKTALQDSLGAANERIKELTTAVNNANMQVAQAQTALAAAKASSQTSDLNVTRLTAAVNATEASRTQLQQQVAALREENTRLQTQNGDLNVALTDTTNKYNVAEATRRDLAEQLQQLRTENERIGGALRDLGGDPNRVTNGGLAAGAPPINGVIRATRMINNMPHAQISVGSDDGVKKDMEFTVLDRTTGQFLGRLHIVAVEPNESIGRLEGPNVASIAAGAEVRTQL